MLDILNLKTYVMTVFSVLMFMDDS